MGDFEFKWDGRVDYRNFVADPKGFFAPIITIGNARKVMESYGINYEEALFSQRLRREGKENFVRMITGLKVEPLENGNIRMEGNYIFWDPIRKEETRRARGFLYTKTRKSA